MGCVRGLGRVLLVSGRGFFCQPGPGPCAQPGPSGRVLRGHGAMVVGFRVGALGPRHRGVGYSGGVGCGVGCLGAVGRVLWARGLWSRVLGGRGVVRQGARGSLHQCFGPRILGREVDRGVPQTGRMAFLKPWFFLGPGDHDPGLAYLIRFPQRLSEIVIRCEASCLDGFCGPGDPSGRVVGTPFVETCQLTAGWFALVCFVSSLICLVCTGSTSFGDCHSDEVQRIYLYPAVPFCPWIP